MGEVQLPHEAASDTASLGQSTHVQDAQDAALRAYTRVTSALSATVDVEAEELELQRAAQVRQGVVGQ